MVLWSDETSEDSVLNISSSCDGIIKLPATMHDPNFNGTDADVNVLCEHGEPAEHFVAFEGMHTGRRFLGCAKKAELSKKEEEKKKLQENYDSLYADVNSLLDAQQQRGVKLNNQKEQKEYVDVKIVELETVVGNLKAELSKTEEEKKKMLQNYETLKNLTCAQANVIRILKFNHLKEKERLTEERLKLKYHISELQKSEEKIKLKLQGVKAILDE
ncbi:uncharacterized protein [Aegilops tauschii subsp. strangulata]|uniref:uncharacterized protein n=1 Tax=Aegilops tauschii subsp. strangulata TaxID=200361 RepID=UPI00098AD295|nr:uncharacterized protein LOC109764435 [Aegilops tauschii subsp. strangulata]